MPISVKKKRPDFCALLIVPLGELTDKVLQLFDGNFSDGVEKTS